MGLSMSVESSKRKWRTVKVPVQTPPLFHRPPPAPHKLGSELQWPVHKDLDTSSSFFTCLFETFMLNTKCPSPGDLDLTVVSSCIYTVNQACIIKLDLQALNYLRELAALGSQRKAPSSYPLKRRCEKWTSKLEAFPLFFRFEIPKDSDQCKHRKKRWVESQRQSLTQNFNGRLLCKAPASWETRQSEEQNRSFRWKNSPSGLSKGTHL